MTNCDLNYEAVKYKEDFENNRISRDLKKHNWLVEKLIQENLIEKFENVSSSTTSQKKKAKPKNKRSSNISKPSKLKSKNVPQNKKEELIPEQCLKQLPSSLKEDKEQFLDIHIDDIAKAIYKKILRHDKYIKRRKNYKKSKAKTREKKKISDKPSLGTIDDLFNNIKVFELSGKDSDDNCRRNIDLETNKSINNSKNSAYKEKHDLRLNQSVVKNRLPPKSTDNHSKKIDKNYIKRKYNKIKRKEKEKINTINITVGDSLTCHLQTFGNIDKNVCKKIEPSIHTEKTKQDEYRNDTARKDAHKAPIECEKCKCGILYDSTKEKKSKSYSVQTQTESVSLTTKEEQDILEFLKLKKLDKVSVEFLLQQSTKELKPVVIKLEEGLKFSNKINNPSELLQAFLKFCDEYKKKTDELGEKISVLFASIKEKETLEISNIADAIEKELENMTRESDSMNQDLDQIMKFHQNIVSSLQIPEAPNIISTEIQQQQNMDKNRYKNFNNQPLPSLQQNANYQQQSIVQQHNLNPQVQLQKQQNRTLQHQTSTKINHQIPKGQRLLCNPLYQNLPSQQTQISQQIQQPTYNTQQLQNYQFQCQPLHQQNWPQAVPIQQIPCRKQNLEQPLQKMSAMSASLLPSQPVATSRQLGQSWNSTQSSQFPTLMRNLHRPNALLPQDQSWRVNRS